MRYLPIIVIIVGWFLIPAMVQAQESVLLTNEQDEYSLGLYLEILEDPTGELTFEQVSSEAYDDHFFQSETEVPSYGLTDAVYWVRFRLKNQAQSDKNWYLEQQFANISELTLYLPNQDPYETGSFYPLETRTIQHRLFGFNLYPSSNQDYLVYMRYKSRSMTISLKVWEANRYIAAVGGDLFMHGVLYGVLLLFAGYNLFLGLSLRDKSYAYYVWFLISIFFLHANYTGVMRLFIFPDEMFLNKNLVMFIPPALMGASLFTDTFLDLGNLAPRWHQLMKISVWFWVISLLLLMVTTSLIVILFVNIVMITNFLGLFIVGLIMSWRGYRPARFFLLGWTTLFIAAPIVLLTRLAILPSNFFTEQGVTIGLLMLILFLSFSLADRINLLQESQSKSQAQALALQNELNQTLQSVNETLEQKVQSRTRRLHLNALLSERLNAMLDFRELLQALVNQVQAQFNYYYVHVYLLSVTSDGVMLVLTEGAGEVGTTLKKQGQTIPLNQQQSLVALAARSGEVVLADDVRKNLNWMPNPLLPNTQSEIAVPIMQKGDVVGVLDVQDETVGRFDEADADLLRSLAGHVAVAMTNARLFEQTKQAKEEADLANQAKSEFLSNISHELRTPLNGILGYTQILKRRHKLDPPVIDGLNIIQQSGNHLLTLINDILDLSKIEARKMELHPITVNLVNFVDNIVRIMRMKATEKNLDFRCEMEDLPTTVVLDEKRLRQILLNLLGNAIKFTSKGYVMLRVISLEEPTPLIKQPTSSESADLSPLTQQQIFRFEVIDTGVGISDEDIIKIFESFEQVGDVKKRAEGTGLGLTITKQLVELMGGDLQVQSQLGQGTTFRFETSLPLIEPIFEEESSEGERTIIGYQGERRRVLIVDDVLSNRVVLRNLLEPLQFELFEGENGTEGFLLAQQYQPDLILTDLVMPELDGLGLIKQLQANPALASIPIIVLSASSFNNSQGDEIIQLSDGFLNKPFDVNDLFNLMAQYLNLEWELAHEVNVPQANAVSTQITIPSFDELEQLQTHAKRGNMKNVQQWAIELIARDELYRPFAEQVLVLAKQFDDEALQKLVEHYLV